MKTRWAMVTILAGLVSCSSAPEMPAGEGKGMLSWDREAPEGVRVFDRPTWTQGDRWRYLRGGHEHLDFRLTSADPTQGYRLVEQGTGLILHLDAEFAEVERSAHGEAGLRRLYAPLNPELHFPLWVGKRWSADYLDKNSEGRAKHILAEFHCDALETIQTPAGRLECLRIWEERRLEVQGRTFLARSALHWYSPEVGWIAKRLEGGTLEELEEYERQRR